MPNIRMTPDEKQLAADIRADFDGAYVLTLAQVGRVIGHKSPHTARKWVAPLIPRRVNGRTVYLVSDVARRLHSTIGEVAHETA